MHVVYLILEYFPLKPGSPKILSPPPPKHNVEVWPEHFCSRLNNIDQGGVGGGVTMVPNSQGGRPVSKKVQNSNHFLSKIQAISYFTVNRCFKTRIIFFIDDLFIYGRLNDFFKA